uniref:Hsp70 family protein n=1 Tax=Salmonella enterica TaxID=28901 RepID=UPI00398C6096
MCGGGIGAGVTVEVVQGAGKAGEGGEGGGEFDGQGVKPRAGGMTEVEVTCENGAYGSMHGTAKGKSGGKEQKSTIKSSSGLTEEGVHKVVPDAGANAASKRTFDELLPTRTQGEQLPPGIRPQVKDGGYKRAPGRTIATKAAQKRPATG